MRTLTCALLLACASACGSSAPTGAAPTGAAPTAASTPAASPARAGPDPAEEAVRAWFEATRSEGSEEVPELERLRHLSSLSVAGGTVQLWAVEWSWEGEMGSDLLVVAPAGQTDGVRADEPSGDAGEPSEEEQPGYFDPILPAVLRGHVVVHAASLERRIDDNPVLRDRTLRGAVEPFTAAHGVLRTRFAVTEEDRFIVDWDECQELEHGPAFEHRYDVLCIVDGASPRCRSVLTRRALVSPGGRRNCSGPVGPAREAGAEERRTPEIELAVLEGGRVQVRAASSDAPPEVLGERALDEVEGVPALEIACPFSDDTGYCDPEMDDEA